MKRKKTKENKEPKVKNEVSFKSSVSRGSSKNSGLIKGLIFGIICLFVCFYFLPDKNQLISVSLSRNIFRLISFICSFIVFLSFLDNKIFVQISKYLFLASLLFLFSGDLIPVSQLVHIKLKIIQIFVVYPAVILGLTNVWFHRKKFNETISELFQQKDKDNSKSVKDKITGFTKNLVIKKNLVYTIGLLLVLGISIYTMFNKLDYFDLYSDESQVTEGAVGYYHTGEYKQWNFIKDELRERNYKRAFPHLFLVAQSYKIFGITPWAGRLVSALFGLLLILSAYFISYFFTRNKLISLVIIFSFAFYFEYLLLFRWTRMYALIIPLYFLMFYFVFKFLTEESKSKFIGKSSFLKDYLNFNYRPFIPFIILLVFTYYLHINSLMILAVIFTFSIVSFIIFREKKYLTIIILGIIVFSIAVSIPQFSRFTERFGFFEVDRSHIYSQFIAGYPFNLLANISILAIGVSLIVLVENKEFRMKLIFLYISLLLGFFLFSYILNYSASFRYISFASPPAVMLIIFLFFLLVRTFYNRIIQTGMFIILLLAILMHFSNRYNDLYVSNFVSPAKPSLVYPEIAEMIKPGELLMMHWGPRYYIDDIDTSINTVKLGSYLPVKFSEIYKELQSAPGSWLTWHTQFKFGVDNKLKKYADKYFIKYHGYGLDSTFVELYYADSTMIKDTSIFFEYEKFIPTANIDIHKPYSFSFFAELPEAGSTIPLYFSHRDKIYFTLEYDIEENKLMFLKDSAIITEVDLPSDRKRHHVFFYISEDGKAGFYIGNKHASGLIGKQEVNLLKMNVNPLFIAPFDDIRLYSSVLKDSYRKQLLNFEGMSVPEIIDEEGEEIEALYKWNKK